MKKLINLILLLIVVLAGSAFALSDTTPTKPALNPVTQTLYVVNNSAVPTAQIKIHDYTGSTWSASGTVITLPVSGAQCFGLAVNAAGNKLYVSVSAGSASRVIYYNLVNGKPNGTPTELPNSNWLSSSSPAGMALDESRNRLYVADKGANCLHIFNTTNNTLATTITDPAVTVHFDVAVSGSQIFVTNKRAVGKILYYNVDASNNVAYGGAIQGSVYPTYLKVSAGKLLAAVNGADGIDVKVYDASTRDLIGNVKSGIVDTSMLFGWVGFDVSADGQYLLFKKSADAGETDNRLYVIKTANITTNSTATRVTGTFIKSDGVVIDADQATIALTDSRSFNIQVIGAGSLPIDITPADTTPPSAINTLSANPGSNANEINLAWTAVGDDNNIGRAASYSAKYSTLPITTDAKFNSAPSFDIPAPQTAGAPETYTRKSLVPAPGQYVFFALKAVDDAGNVGPLGNYAVTIARDTTANQPVVNRIYPSIVPTGTTTSIIVEGKFFVNPTTTPQLVKLEQASRAPVILSTTYISGTKLRVTIPAATAVGAYDIRVTTAGGVSDNTAGDDLTVIAAGSDTTEPLRVADFRVSVIGDTQLTLAWTNPSEGDLDKVLVARNTGTWPAIDGNGNVTAGTKVTEYTEPSPASAVSYVDSPLTNGTEYFYAVYSRDTSGNWNTTTRARRQFDAPFLRYNADTATPNAAASDPTLDLTVYLEGYYDVANTTQFPATLGIELRSSLTNIAKTYDNIVLDNTGHAVVPLTGLGSGSFYVVIKHYNHIPIMTQNSLNFAAGSTVTLNMSNTASASYVAAYKPSPTDAETMVTAGNLRLMMVGDANADRGIDIQDFLAWVEVNGSQVGQPNWTPAVDFNGDSSIDISDFLLWVNNNGLGFCYVP